MTEQQPEDPALPGVTRFRVREPVTLDAIRWTGGNADAIREFGAAPDLIPVGCYVLKGVTGHVFTVDAERFAAIYEPASEEKAPAVPPAPVAASLDPVEELRRIADQDIGANAPWLADKLHAFADQLAAEMRGECQMDAPAAVFDREAAGRIVHETRLFCEEERAALEGRQKFNLKPWEQRTYEQQETDMRIAEAVSAAVRERGEEKAKLAAVAAYLEEHKGDAGLSLMHVWDLWAIIGAGKAASRE